MNVRLFLSAIDAEIRSLPELAALLAFRRKQRPLHVESYLKTAGRGYFTATFYIQVASIAGIVAGGWWADRWSARSERARLYTQSLGLAIASPFLFLLGYTDSAVVLDGALALFGVGRGFYEANTMPVLRQVARNELLSTGYGVVAAGAGALKDKIGLASALEIAGGILCLGSVLLPRIRWKYKALEG